jgi:ABC-type branched-subunit amino acid transport system ATPase component
MTVNSENVPIRGGAQKHVLIGPKGGGGGGGWKITIFNVFGGGVKSENSLQYNNQQVSETWDPPKVKKLQRNRSPGQGYP